MMRRLAIERKIAQLTDDQVIAIAESLDSAGTAFVQLFGPRDSLPQVIDPENVMIFTISED